MVQFLLKNGGRFIRVQHAFKQRFQLKHLDSVPSYLTMSQWLTSFHKTGAATNICCYTYETMIRMPEYVEHVRIIIEHGSQATRILLC